MLRTALDRGPAISVRCLRKDFGPVPAVRDVSFSVASGEVLGFLGPNGAGKSTTMKMITGYLPVTSGEIKIGGLDIQLAPVASRRQVGYLPEGSPLYGEMTPAALLDFVASVRGLGRCERRERIGEIVAALMLEPVMLQSIDTLSKGYKRRVGLAQAVLGDPPILILDEPTDGLDPNQKHLVRNLIRSLGQRKAVIISTHLLDEVDAVCDRAVIIDRGRLVFSGTPSQFHALAPNHNAVLVRVEASAASAAATLLTKIEGCAALEAAPANDNMADILVRPENGVSLAHEVSTVLRENGIKVLELRTETGRLEEVFRLVTAAAQEPITHL